MVARSWILSLGISLPLVGVALGAVGCARPAAPVASVPQPQFRLTATIQDLMEGLVDPSADALWDSVAYIATTAGTEDRRPRTAGEWKAVRVSAVNLIEAANLLSMPGRRVALRSAAGPGELAPPEIQRRIDASHGAFVQFAHALQDAGTRALAAIDAKDAQGLMDTGGVIDEACEACHVTYWYPNQNRPGT
jgi:hypothetical protein